ncbi:DEKNAAC101880 [Brettanomyces naardenensis]|uniref:DEKNAAC101881 n=1 Tax=Brettanomyces naardenensis TaxID=13370 RepID=A0A448YJ49_BRENA|nr:DEKNAAC101880 [Brettanomyces naardenensis]
MEKFEVIDEDPEFNKVVRYFRPRDYAIWAGSTAFAPALLHLMERYEPVSGRTFKAPPAMFIRAAGLIGFVGGFILAYNDSTKRFWGLTENEREVEKDRFETKKLLSQGRNPYGVDRSSLTPYLQDVASRNSNHSQLLLAFIPWFNFANHPNHGVDLKKYYEVRKGEEKWGFDKLVPLEQIPGVVNKN